MKNSNKNLKLNVGRNSIIGLMMMVLVSCGTDDKDVKPGIDFDYMTYEEGAIISSSSMKYYDDGSSNLTVTLYNVENAIDESKPLVILAPGGGWLEYNQTDKIQALAVNLSHRGYATAVIQYTIGAQNADVWLKSYLDMKVAVKFFKKHAAEYEIDPDQIFTGGWSTGAQIAMYAASLDQPEVQGFQQEILHTILDAKIESLGTEPTIYPEYTSSVRGNVLLMPYAWDESFFDENGPAVMMIANPNSVLSSGEKIWGEFVTSGVNNIGPDLMFDRLVAKNYVDGNNLEFIQTDPALDLNWDHVNSTSLDPAHFPMIAEFIANNLD